MNNRDVEFRGDRVAAMHGDAGPEAAGAVSGEAPLGWGRGRPAASADETHC